MDLKVIRGLKYRRETLDRVVELFLLLRVLFLMRMQTEVYPRVSQVRDEDQNTVGFAEY